MSSKTAKKGRTLADLRALHDRDVVVPNKIRAAIEALKASGEQWEYEGDLIKRANISQTDIAAYRDQFTDFWHIMPTTHKSAPRRVYFATKQLAAAWKEGK